MNGGWFVCRNFPELREPAKMIEAHIVEIVRDPTHSVDPPRITLLLHRVPAIQRIAPTLSVFAEKIGRHTGNDLGIELGVQAKLIGVGPDIGTVEVYKDRDVTHHANRMLRTIRSKRLPLFVEKKLQHAAE